jgi:hypothetical protein
MKIFFYVMVHDHPSQLSELVSALEESACEICIHVDAKAKASEFTRIVPPGERIKYIDERVRVNWGGFSQVKAMLAGMRQFLNSECSYFVNLSGQDFPALPIRELVEFLETSNGSNFISGSEMALNWSSATYRYERFHFVDALNNFKAKFPSFGIIANKVEAAINILFAGVKRKVPGKLPVFAGSGWFMLERNAVDHILQTWETNGRLVRFFSRTVCADEMFFHTILFNSRLKDTIVPNNYRFAKFIPGTSNPEVLTEADIGQIRLSRAFFARKFHPQKSRQLMSMLKVEQAHR